MGIKLEDFTSGKYSTAPTSVVKVGTTPTQSYVSGSSLLGGVSVPTLSQKITVEEPKVENKNTGLEIVGRGLAALPGSIAKGTTSAIDKITDTPAYVRNLIAQSQAKKNYATRVQSNAAKANAAYEKARDTHVLGQGVQNWQNKVDARQDQIVLDNPNSKVAEYTGKALQLGEAVGEMLPSVAASALVGGVGITAMGGKQALALAGTSAAKAAAVSTAGKLGQAVGLGVMAMDVYAKSLDESTALGYDFATSSKKAFGDAVLEVGTEMLFGGIAGLGTGVVSQVSKNVVNRSLARAAASEGAEQLIKMTGVEKAVLSVAKAATRVSAMTGSTAFSRLASNAFGEAAEEMIAEFLGPYIERMTTNPNASNASIDQIIEAGIGGAIVSFAMSPLGKLQTMIGTPDADIVEKARLTYKLQDYDQNVRMMKDLIYDAVAGEDLTAVEKQMGRELTKVSGDNVARGLTSDYQRQAARILNDLEASGHTAVDVSNAWKSLGELYAQVSQDRSDAAAARIHNDVAKNTLISESESVKKAQAAVDEAKVKFDEAVKAYDIAVNRNDGSIDTEAARKSRAETERTLKNAQANLEKAIENARRGAELRLSKEDAAEKYGQEAVDNFLASQRVRDIQRGRFYVADANGNERLYTKDQYAAEKFGGKRYSQLTKAQKAEVDAASKAYQDAVTKELEAFAKRVNDAITQRGLGGKLRVELVKPGAHKFDVGYAHNGVIYFTQERVHTTEAADYFLSHEFLHAIEDKFISQEDAAAFHKTIRSAMDTIGFNYDEWFARLAKRYESSYLPRIKSEAKQKGKKGKEFDSYVKQKFVKLVEGEIRARFMQTAFSSQSILQSLAVETPELLERAKQSVNDSSIAELTDTMWDYERLVILDRINKALTAPVSAETNKKKNAEAVDMAFAELYDRENTDVGGEDHGRNKRYYVARNERGVDGSDAERTGARVDSYDAHGLLPDSYWEKRKSLSERYDRLDALAEGAETGTLIETVDGKPVSYTYVKNPNDLPGNAKDMLADVEAFSRLSVSLGRPNLEIYYILQTPVLKRKDGIVDQVGAYYSPHRNAIVVPLKSSWEWEYDDYNDFSTLVNVVQHEKTHVVARLIPESLDLFKDELFSWFSPSDVVSFISAVDKSHLDYYGHGIDSANDMMNELFANTLGWNFGDPREAGALLSDITDFDFEKLYAFREHFAPVLTSFVKERGLDIDFTKWLEPTKTELEKQSLKKEILHEEKLLFRDAIDAWASDNGLNIDDLDFFKNGPNIYVVKKQSSEILDIDTMMSIPESDYVAILNADSDDNGVYLSGGLYEDLYSAETEEYPYFTEEDRYFADIDSSDDFDLDYELESYRNMLQDAPEETIVRLYSKGTGNAKYKEISRNGAVRKLNIMSDEVRDYANQVRESNLGKLVTGEIGLDEFSEKTGLSLDAYMAARQYGLSALDLAEVKSLDKFRQDLDLAKAAVSALWGKSGLLEWLGNVRNGNLFGPTIIATGNNLLRAMEQIDSGNKLYSYADNENSNVILSADAMREDILRTYEERLRRRYGQNDPRYFEDLEDDGIGMTEERLRQYRELQQKYGENEFGVPNKINSNVATSKFASRLAANKANIWSTDADGNTTMTGVNTPEELAASLRDGFLNGVNTHIVMTDDAAIAEARSRIDRHKEKTYSKDGKVIKETVVKHKTINDAFTYAKGLLTSGKVLNKNDLAFAQQLIVEMTNQYKELNEGSDNVQPIESKNTEELFNQIQELVADTCAAATRAGQNLQAFSLLKKMTPTGRLYYIESQADQLISELVDRRGQSRVSGYFFEKDSKGNVRLDKNNKPKRIIISDELRKKMYECTTKEEMNAVEEEIIAEIASKIDPSLMDRVTAWRYLSMLGNPRTHVRNIVSNFTMGTMVKAKNRVGGALEDIFLKDKTQGRTKTLKAIDPELRKSLTDFAENDWAKDGMSDVALSGGKVGFQNRINEARKKMKLDILDKAAKKNNYLLELEDDRAGKRAYKEAFVRYAAANNLTVEYLSAGTVESNVALAQARSYAVNEAAKATYHDASKVASMLNELEHMSGSAGAAAKLLIGGIAPFKKTPINILSRGIEYSPIGLVDGLVKTIKACQSTTEDIFEVDGKKVTRTEYETTYGGKGGKFVKSSDYTGEYSATSSADALDLGKDDSHGKPFERFSADAKRTKAIADALDQMAAGLTGTGLMIVGALLAQLGLMKGSGDDENKDAEYYDQMLGNQEYSITIGNKNYTLDWLTPVSMPLFAGVELHNAKVDGGEMSFEELIDAIGRVADPITNLSFLQGVNDAMSEYDSGLYSFARSAAESFAGQFVPTVFGQVARSIDPTRRTTYAPKDSAAGKKAATFINKMENKIPGLSQKNAAYVDLWGRTETNNGDTFVGRLFMNSVVPTYVRTVNKTEADDYLTQLFAKTGDNSIIPKSPESSYTVSGETFYLTSQEYQQTKELVGQLSHVGVTSLLSVPGFAELSAEDQADLVSDVYSFAKRVAKEDYAYANGIEISADSTNTKIKNAVLAGMSIGEAVYVYKMANLVEGVKNSKGNTISGSKKANLLSFYRTMGLTNEQINAIKPSNYDFDL